MRANFNRSLDFTLDFEGGYVNHPKDPGGHTNKGVTLATLRRFKPGATVADLKAISIDLVRAIYKDGYWDKVGGDTLRPGVDLATFDYGVNSGPSAALKSLRAVVGGPDHETVKKLCARRLSIYQTFRHWKSFGKGWTRRIVACEALGVKWAMAADPVEPTAPIVVAEKLRDEADAAKKQATKDTGKAGGSGATAGGGGAVGVDQADQIDMIAGLVLGGLVVVGIAATIYFVWRAYINRKRAEAFREEADK